MFLGVKGVADLICIKNEKNKEKKLGNVLLFPKKIVPLHSQFRNVVADNKITNAPLAQLVEQLTLNQWV